MPIQPDLHIQKSHIFNISSAWYKSWAPFNGDAATPLPSDAIYENDAPQPCTTNLFEECQDES